LAAEGDRIVESAIIFVSYETPNKNYLSLEHTPLTKDDMYELVYVGDGTPQNPGFLSLADFYKKATDNKLQLVPAIDSQGRGPIIEVVVSDDWARPWGRSMSSSFVNDIVLPRAAEQFNFYEWATSIYTTGSDQNQVRYAALGEGKLSLAIVISGYAAATDYDYVMFSPNIDGGIGAPNNWASAGSGRNVGTDYYVPQGAKSKIEGHEDLDLSGLRLRFGDRTYIATTGGTSPVDNHSYGPMGTGVHAHEMGHAAFGFTDVYDTAGQTRVNTVSTNGTGWPRELTPYPIRPGLGNWSIMGGGLYIYYTHPSLPTSALQRKWVNPVSLADPLETRSGYLDAYNLEIAGVLATELTDRDGNVLPEYEGKTITINNLNFETYKLWGPPVVPQSGDLPASGTGSNPATVQQYFLLQARADLEEDDYDNAPFQWGRKFARPADKPIKGGVLILHIDPDFSTSSGNANVSIDYQGQQRSFSAQLAPLSMRFVWEEAHGGIQHTVQRKVYDRSINEGDVNHGDPGDLFGPRVKEFGPNTAPSNRAFFSPRRATPGATRYADAGFDPYRQTRTPGQTQFGEPSKWHISEISFDVETRKASFKITSAKPGPTVTERKLARSELSSADVASLAAGVTEIDSITVSDPANAYLTNLTGIDITNDPAYTETASDIADGTEYRAEVGEGNGLLVDLNFELLHNGSFALINAFEPGETIDITSRLPDYVPAREGRNLKVRTLVVDGRVENSGGVIFSASNPIFGVKIEEIDGEQLLVIYDGVKDGEANNALLISQAEGGVRLDKNSAKLLVGDTVQLNASFTPEGISSPLEWSSDNESVVTVSDTGLVTALATGTATVTVSALNLDSTDTATITVEENSDALSYVTDTPAAAGTSDTNGEVIAAGSIETSESAILDQIIGIENPDDSSLAQDIIDLFTISHSGKLFADGDAVKSALPDNSGIKSGTEILGLPVASFHAPEEAVSVYSILARLDKFAADTFADLAILAVPSGGTPALLTRASNSARIGEGEYAIFRNGAPVPDSAHPETGAEYIIVIGVRDNGAHDLDTTAGSVLVDPLAVAERSVGTGTGSSGGCDSGFGAFALTALVGSVIMRRRVQR
jgi:hypothetical protein